MIRRVQNLLYLLFAYERVQYIYQKKYAYKQVLRLVLVVYMHIS